MTIDISFNNIIPRGGSQTKAFEELCTQIARKTLKGNAVFERFHGDGGDGGVECVVRLDDRSIIAWQSKFVTGVDDLIKQASKSLATAVKIHPTLKKYIVCFPFDPTGQTGRTNGKGRPAQSGSLKLEKWVKETLEMCKKDGDVLEEIELWPANRLLELLLKYDLSTGIRTYFFSDTIIPQTWFQRNIEANIKKAGPRYNPQLTVETGVWQSFAAFGQTESWDAIISTELQTVRNQLKDFGSNIEKPATDPVFPGFPEKFSNQATTIVNETATLLKLMSGLLNDTVVVSADEKLGSLLASVQQLEQELVNDLNEQYKNENWDTAQWRTFMREYMVSFPAATLDRTRDLFNCLTRFKGFIKSRNVKLASEKVFVLSGIGGSGKTHCICDIAEQRLNNNLLGCIVFGDQFSGNPDEWTRFGEALGLRNISSDQMLDALNAAALQSGKPLIIFLDAINESMPRRYWQERIVAFADEISKRPYLKFCISCRTSFLQVCLPESHDFIIVDHTGFKGLERKACNTFFKYYGLTPPLIPILQPELGNPLYLKLVCETLKAKGLKDLPPGWTGLLPVINAFLLEKEKQLCRQYDISSSGKLVVKALTAIIEEISHRTESSLSWTDAVTAVSTNNPPVTAHNILDWLIKADLLIEDGPIDDNQLNTETYVRPAFERLGDFLLATELAKQATTTGIEAFLSHLKVQEILKDHESIELNASLIAALSVILPECHGTELPSLLENSPLYAEVALIASKTLIWRTPESLTDDTRIFVKSACQNDGYAVMDALFAICTNTSRLDALWLTKILAPTNLAYRDAFFAPYLKFRYDENGYIKNLIEAHRDLDLPSVGAATAYRWLIALLWLMAAPDRRIKDSATRAGVEILRHNNQVASDLLDQLMDINDEEVVERLLTIIYAAQILNPDKVALADVVLKVTNKYEGQPEAFQNALTRDNIRCLAELAQQLDCLPNSIEPLLSTQTDKQDGWVLMLPVEDRVKSWQKERGAIGLAAYSTISDDFNHYSIGCLRPWFENLNKQGVGKWIINDVVERKGLCDEIHNAYDITILRETGGGRGRPTYAERIGKKYQWNSLYRLASILHDKAERDNGYDPDPVRTPLILQEERKMDPTFTQPYFVEGSDSKNWWLKEKPNLFETENLPYTDWLDFNSDIPAMSQIISVVRYKEQNWIPLSAYLSFSTSKQGDFDSPYRLLTMHVNSYLVKDVDTSDIVNKLNGKNLYLQTLPSSGKFSHCYLGEYPWATACNTEPDWYLGVGDSFGKNKTEMHNTTNEMVVEWEYDYTIKGNIYLQVPSKKLFLPENLWWNGKDGYMRADKKTVFKDPRIETGGHSGFLADFEDLVSRLKKLKCSMIWAITGEKLLINQRSEKDRKYFSQICWMDANGQMNFGNRMFFKNHDSKTGIEGKG